MHKVHAATAYLFLLLAAVLLIRGGKHLVAVVDGVLATAPAGAHAVGYAAGQLAGCTLMLAAGAAYLWLATRAGAGNTRR